ncbi:MAG: RNA polymerase-associated protein RapA [Bacteroidetes bacterium]|nr:MAG: RNA polymerase-associated protein RapA [Bacteroidota bacterium]
MGDFFSNQRYTSKGEPELGVGFVTNTSKGKVEIYFPISDTTRLYAAESAPLQRVIFKPSDRISDKNGRTLVVEHLELADDLYRYFGAEGSISEADLGDVSAKHSVDDKLFQGEVDSPQSFALRRETLEQDYRRRLSPVKGFVGGRIDLIPHQLYIAHEVSERYAPRVLLSDQVGLGKTIEACLILHRLLLSGRISRVLILVPESLVHQWFVEVLRRFNMWFNIFDEERCAALDDNAPEGNPFLDNQLILCSTEFLAESAQRTQQALQADWDMLVVDEAHNLEWSQEKISPEYAVVELLSQAAQGLLLLTATPEQLGLESHFARLRLLDPERYSNYQDFLNESSEHKDIAHIVEKLHLGESLNTKEKKTLESIFPRERTEAINKLDATSRNELIEDLLDQHGPGRVLFRNTRAAMQGFPQRIPHLIPLETEDTPLWQERFCKEFTNDTASPASETQAEFWFKRDPRIQWLLKFLEEIDPAKVLLICKSKEKVLALHEAFSKLSTLKVGLFHEELTIVQRDRNAAWFTESEGAQVLLCSEIGSEGRNFQFAHHLVLFDLPLNPELLEQRIGRLDRIGQKEDIHIHVPYLNGSPQHFMARWYQEGLNAFAENLEGGNSVFKLFSKRLLSICLSPLSGDAHSALDTLIKDTADFQKQLRKNLAEGRDKLLEMNSFRPEVAKDLITQIEAEDQNSTLEKYLSKVFRHFDMEMEDLSARTYYLHPASQSTEAFPSIPREGLSVTFLRQQALIREDISFLTWDHPISTSAMDMVLSSGTGSASFGILKGANSPGLVMELIFLLETSGAQNTYADRFLPNTPLRIVVNHQGKEVTDSYPADKLSKKLQSGKIEALLENDTLVQSILPNMIDAATEIAEEQSAREISRGLRRMKRKLNHEISRLESLQERNKNIRPEELAIAREERETLSDIINNARLRLDAILLIRVE